MIKFILIFYKKGEYIICLVKSILFSLLLTHMSGEFHSLSLYFQLVCFLLSDLRVFSLLILDVLLSTFSKTKLMESMVK